MAKWTNRDAKLQFGITENLSIERQIHVQYMPKCINKSNIIKFCNATSSCIRIWVHSLQILKLFYVFVHCVPQQQWQKQRRRKTQWQAGALYLKWTRQISMKCDFWISLSESLCVYALVVSIANALKPNR